MIEKHHAFYWTFDSDAQMIEYCKSLFGMTQASHGQVRDALLSHFEIERKGGKTRLPWGLIYGVGRKA